MSETNNIELQVQGGEQPEIRLQVNGLNSKADKVEGATAGNFAGLDATGNLTDSGYKAADFATAEEIGTVPSGQTVEGQITALNANITQLVSAKADMIVVKDDTESAVKSFADGGNDYPMALTVGIDPVQDLHGFDAPYPPGGGKNLLQNTAITDTINDVTFTVNADGTVSLSGTASATTIFDVGTVDVKNGNTYILSGCPASGSTSTYLLSIPAVGYDSGSGYTYSPSADATVTIRITVYSGTNVTGKVFKPMLCLSTATDPTVFAPYSNICPISGWTGVEITRTGKNLNPGAKYDASIYTARSDGSVLVDGSTGDAIRNYYFITNAISKANAIHLPAGTYTAHFEVLSGSIGSATGGYGFFYWEGSSETRSAAQGSISTASVSKTFTTDVYIIPFIYFSASVTISNAVVGYQLEIGSESSAYVPYSGQTYPITFPTPPGTVYGGTLSVNKDGTGELVVTHGKYKITEDTSVAKSSETETVFVARVNPVEDGYPSGVNQTMISDMFSQNIASGNAGRMVFSNNILYLVLSIAEIGGNTEQLAKAWLVDNDPTFVYQLTTPQTYTLSAPQVETLKGLNNLWASTGNVKAVSYSADTKLYIDQRIAALLASLQ